MKVKISGIEIETDEDRVVSGVTLNINYENQNITNDITYIEENNGIDDEPITPGNILDDDNIFN